MKKIESEITAVIVYTDRALITRTGKISLDSGEHHLFFDNLPESIEQKSIRLSGSGGALLRDIHFKTVYFAETQSDLKRKIIEKQKELNEELDRQHRQIELADLEREFLDKITDKITTPEKIRNSGELNPDSWIQMISFYRSKLEDLENQKSQSEKKCLNISEELQKLEIEQYQLDGGSDKTRNQVDVTIEKQEEGELTLELHYIVYGPGWYPHYDFRVSTENKNMNITYYAMVTQASSEDWSDVQLKLSTARPQIDGTIPRLSSWHLNLYSQTAPPVAMSRDSASPLRSKKAMAFDQEICEDFEESSIAMSISVPETRVETQASSVVFVPSGRNSVPGDNTPHKVTILIEDFPARLQYGSVPKLSPFSYLKAQVTNHSDYPLLAGECNVFMDSDFVSNVSINTVSPGEEFWTSLGIDESMVVERKFIKRFEKKEGMLGKKRKFIYEYLMILENKKNTDEILILQDQIPISGHQDIIVELISPKLEKNSGDLKMNNEKILQWDLTLKAREKIEIPFSFSVEYPRNESLTGLE